MKKVVDFCEKVVMDRHERRRQKLLKNRNKDFETEGSKTAESAPKEQ